MLNVLHRKCWVNFDPRHHFQEGAPGGAHVHKNRIMVINVQAPMITRKLAYERDEEGKIVPPLHQGQPNTSTQYHRPQEAT